MKLLEKIKIIVDGDWMTVIAFIGVMFVLVLWAIWVFKSFTI